MSLTTVRNLWRSGILGLAAGHTAIACQQQSMNTDGLNYLTLGRAFWSGDPASAISGIWSPLYGVLAAGAIALVDPPIDWVFPTVQIVNFLIFAVSLLCFERLWSELLGSEGETNSKATPRVSPDGQGAGSGATALWWSIGYGLFLWGGLNLIEIWAVTPDMLVAALVYLAAAAMVRIGAGRGTWRTQAWLGATLGVGYLAKAPLFPLGLVALGLTALTAARLSDGIRRSIPAVVAFALVAGPLVTATSVRAGRPAFSEVGRFTYLKHVNRIPFPHWRDGEVDGVGVPTHLSGKVHADPDAYVWEGPVAGPYPPSTDPDYWTEGLSPRIDLFQQLNEVGNGLAFYFTLFFRTQGPLVGIAALILAGGFLSGVRPRIRQGAWHLTAWAVACFAMYSLVFVTHRYVAPFVLLFWAGLFGTLRSYARHLPTPHLAAAGGLVVLFTGVNILALNVEGATALLGFRPPVEVEARGQFAGSGGAGGTPPAVAAGLLDAGFVTGDDIAYIGNSYTAFWAFLVNARIVGEIWPEEADAFWALPSARREDILAHFRSVGATWIVAGAVPVGETPTGSWTRLGSTGYWGRPLTDEQQNR